MRALLVGEAVQVETLRRGGVPSGFVWRGQRHQVRAIESRRPRTRQGGDGAVYVLRTTRGLRCQIASDGVAGAWRLEKVLNAGGGRNERGHAVV
jgi:hypothetical protein